jgi:hypothetical protein
MKHVKSVLAVVMVLVIGVCISGCQSAEEKAELERLIAESIAVEESIAESIAIAESVAETQKAENVEFSEWFTDVSIATSGMTMPLPLSDYACEHLDSIKSATLTIGKNVYSFADYHLESASAIYEGTFYMEGNFQSFTDFASDASYYSRFFGLPDGGDLDISDVTLYITFADITVFDYDSLTVTIIDRNGEDVTLTYYPNVE